jgi:decaprenylphosphoryl-5-phosphoribose phosphatase
VRPYTRSGNHGLLWVGIGAAAGRPVRVAATVWGTLAANYAVKLAVRRERPLEPGVVTLVPAPSSSSFPSSHAAMSTAAAVVLCAARPRLAPLWVAMAAAMAWSRVYAGVHHRSDVAAGVALGAVTGAVAVVV